MSTSSTSSSVGVTLSLLALFDDVNRINDVLNGGEAEERFLQFIRQTEWLYEQWRVAQSESKRLQLELDESIKAQATWEAKFANARKIIDAEKKLRVQAVEEAAALKKQMVLARELLFNDNRNKLNDETLEKLAFLQAGASVAHDDRAPRLNAIPEFNSTGTMLSDASFSRSEDDLDLSHVNARRSWVRHAARRSAHNSSQLAAPSPRPYDQPVTKKRRSSTSSAAQVVDQNGRVLATATTVLTLEGALTEGMKTPSHVPQSTDVDMEDRDGISGPKDTVRSYPSDYPPSAPPHTDTESGSDVPWPGTPGRTAATWGSPRSRPKQHTFVTKSFFGREVCMPCGKKTKFAKVGLRCEVCRGVCHTDCRDLMPLPCLPQRSTPQSEMNKLSIAELVPGSPPLVPALLVHCINEVEARGLQEVGIYRVSPVDKEVRKLKEKFMRGRGAPPLAAEDIHVVCGCIKDFLRSLREPLLTTALRNEFLNAGMLQDKKEAAAAVIKAVAQLPPPNRDTLAFLMLHLQKVAESEECRMPLDNLAKVFSPTVMGWDSDSDAEDLCIQTQRMLNVVEILLLLPADFWAQFAGCEGLRSPRAAAKAAPASASTLPRPAPTGRGFFYSPHGDQQIKKPRKFYF